MPRVAASQPMRLSHAWFDTMYVVNARSFSQPGGLGRYTREIGKRLATANTKFIAPARPECGSLGGLLWEQFALPRHVGPHDVLWSPANLGPIRVRNQVVTIHDMAVFDHPEWFSQGVRRGVGALLPRLVRSVRYVITVSGFSKERLLAHFDIDPEQVVVVYPGVGRLVGADCAEDGTIATDDATASNGAHSRVPYAIAYGPRDPRKNLRTLIDAWSYVGQEVPDLELTVVGQPSSRTFARNTLANGAPGIRWAGYLQDSELADLYSGASLFVYPSLYEGFGLPPLEAMLYGVPSVVSDIPVLREVYGESVRYVDPYDPVDVARGIIETVRCSSARDQLVKTFAATVRKYSWDRAGEAVCGILDRVDTSTR